jgi:hypothetical protein
MVFYDRGVYGHWNKPTLNRPLNETVFHLQADELRPAS